MRDDTTIAIQKTTMEKLGKLKVHERETYDDLLNRIMDDMLYLEKQINKLRGKNKKLKI